MLGEVQNQIRHQDANGIPDKVERSCTDLAGGGVVVLADILFDAMQTGSPECREPLHAPLHLFLHVRRGEIVD
jgi:hypothetical protein